MPIMKWIKKITVGNHSIGTLVVIIALRDGRKGRRKRIL
jgi:hypothetical protein